MIEVRNIEKTFRSGKKQKKALKGVSFTAVPGEIFGLLGPNGAGKTTTLRMIATLLKPDVGTITVQGMDTVRQGRAVRNEIGLLTGDMKLSGTLSPREMLKFFGDLNHLSRTTSAARITELSGYLDMGEFLDRPIEKLSSGMKQKTSIAVSLMHDPNVILFDEPTSNLDVLAVKVVVDFLKDAARSGKTVILSTHVLSEAEKLCDRIGIMLEGEMAASGSRQEILASRNADSLENLFFAIAEERGIVS